MDARIFGDGRRSLHFGAAKINLHQQGREFDVAYDEHGLFVLTMHPHISGHRSRVAWLEKLIAHMKSKAGVWFATEEEIARYLKNQGTTKS